METGQGIFIVVEGTDGSGKGTQFELLAERLRSAGHDVMTFDFPQYSSPSSYFVRQYLNGMYGSAEEVGPYTGSLFYALDRYEAAPHIRNALEQGKVVLANRYVGSNMAHQGTKFAHAEERRGYFIWLDNLEFEMLRIPRPTISFVLRVPAEISQQLVDQKEERAYTDKKRDLHEADLSHLKKALAVYDDLCQLFPKDFLRIDCVRDNQLLSIPTISDILWEKIKPLLPEPNTQPTIEPGTAAATVGTRQHSIAESVEPVFENKPAIRTSASATQEPRAVETAPAATPKVDQTETKAATSNAKSTLYAFADTLSPAIITQALRTASQQDNDIRTTLAQLLQAAAQNAPDRATARHTNHYVVIEQASTLLAQALQSNCRGALVQQFEHAHDQKDATGQYHYYTPGYFDAQTKEQYQAYLNQLFDLHANIVNKLTEHLTLQTTTPPEARNAEWQQAQHAQAREAARAILPVATTTTVAIFGSSKTLEGAVTQALSNALPEARQAGKQLLTEIRAVQPAFLLNLSQQGGSDVISYQASVCEASKQLADAYLPVQHAASNSDAVQLAAFWPRNEFDLIPHMLYEHSSLPFKTIAQEVALWAFSQKQEIFDAYLGERFTREQQPGPALEHARYTWDMLTSYQSFGELQLHFQGTQRQELTPRYGFAMPKLIEDAGLDEQFELCFDLSLRLHSLLQRAGYRQEAQYATLLGHRVRWAATHNAREAYDLHELSAAQSPENRDLIHTMYEKLAEVHPTLAEAMCFANQPDRPELTRRATERYAQYQSQQPNTQA